MLRNYFKTTFRSLRKNRLFSAINIFGLSVGLAASILILQYASFELGFDKFHSKSDRLYRVMNERFEGEKLIQRGQITYSAVGKQMFEDYPEIVNYFTLNTFGQNVFQWDENIIKVPFTILVEPQFFDMLDFKVLAGNPRDVFNQKQKVVFSESMASRIFGTETDDWTQYLGEIVTTGASRTPYEVVGIIETPRSNSSLQYETIISRATVYDWWQQSEFSWTGSDYFHYIELAEGVDYKEFQKKFEDFSQTYFKGDEITGTFEKFHLQPLEDVYLYSDYEYENHEISDGRMVWVLILIAGFIIVMAWVNYINLTTSRSLKRAREVGVRKVVGATRSQLVRQFLVESIVLNLVSLVLAITLIQIIQQPFNFLVSRDLNLIHFLGLQVLEVPALVWLLGIILMGSVLSGLYPAFVLSKFKPAESLKGEFSNTGRGKLLRKGLVVFQFALSTALISGTFLVYKQTNFMRNQNLGVNLDRVLTVEGPSLTSFDSTFVERIHSFINKLEQNPNVLGAGSSSFVLGQRLPRIFNARTTPESEGRMLNRLSVNFGFLSVYDVKLLAGRDFEPTDHDPLLANIESVILNDKASKLLGFETPEDALGEKLIFYGKDWRVVGVTTDFHHRSLRESIEPLIMMPMYEGGGDTYHLKISGNNIKETMDYIAQTYDEFYPGDLLEYRFMDERFNMQYESDQKFGQIFNWFSILAILIACLGLLGLAGYTAIQRTKEIGIRKVLGASIRDILTLLSQEFLVLIVLAGALGLPLIYFGALQWLSAYEYQTTIGWAFFVLPLIAVIGVALLIVFGQTIKTAKANPISALRQE